MTQAIQARHVTLAGKKTGTKHMRRFYSGPDIAASVSRDNSTIVDVSINVDHVRIDKYVATAQTGPVMKEVLAEEFRSLFSREISKVVEAYRLMLRESMAKGDDAVLQTALNRARLQEKILSETVMVDQTQACQLLGLSLANPSASMKRKEDKRAIMRFTIDGRAIYPLLQFDIEGRGLYGVMSRLIALKPQAWSDFRLLHWLTRPHLDFGASPSEMFGSEPDAVVAAFKREIVPSVHG